jgi:pimeloyl-ACP methyl ester carboxylesterase
MYLRFVLSSLALIGFLALAQATELTLEQRKFIQPLQHSQPELGFYEQNIQILKPNQVTPDTPIVLFLGSEAGPGDLRKMSESFRQQRDIIAVQADHRGYGSYSKDLDQTVPAYVSMEQALEDFHQVILSLKKEFQRPVVLVGYSYSATLAILLAAQYPDSVDAIYASSPTVRFPKVSYAHDEKMNQDWSPSLYQSMVSKVSLLSSAQLGDQQYEDRLFLQTLFVGSVQYARFSPLKNNLEKTSPLDLKTFLTTWKGIDQQLAGGLAAKWALGQNTLKLSLSEAQTLNYHSRYWAYQQCQELGSFFISVQANSLFPQTFDDYSEYCQKMFGILPQVMAEWDIVSKLKNIEAPMLVVNGRKDPWLSIQVSEKDLLSQNTQLFMINDGYHCPDREDPVLEQKLILELFKRMESIESRSMKK